MNHLTWKILAWQGMKPSPAGRAKRRCCPSSFFCKPQSDSHCIPLVTQQEEYRGFANRNKSGFPAGSVGRVCPQCRRSGFDPWIGKIYWSKEWLPTLVFLPGESHGRRSLVGYSLRHHESRIWLSDWTCLPCSPLFSVTYFLLFLYIYFYSFPFLPQLWCTFSSHNMALHGPTVLLGLLGACSLQVRRRGDVLPSPQGSGVGVGNRNPVSSLWSPACTPTTCAEPGWGLILSFLLLQGNLTSLIFQGHQQNKWWVQDPGLSDWTGKNARYPVRFEFHINSFFFFF